MVHLEQEPSLGSTSSSGSSNMSSSDAEPSDRGSAKAILMQNPAITTRQKSRESDNPASPPAQEPSSSNDAVVSPNAGANTAASSGQTQPPKHQLQQRHSLPTFVGSNRGRIVSLDRGQAEVTIPAQGNVDDDDDSTVTSDGESSYFAKHLPSPKSGTRFSFNDNASTSSAPVALYRTHSQKLESDASLSFSDDDEDDLHASGHPPQRFGDSNIYSSPNGITRVHSVSSLVSSPAPPLTSSAQVEPSWSGNVEDKEAAAAITQQRSQSSPPNTYGTTVSAGSNMPHQQQASASGERRRSADAWLLAQQQQHQQWIMMNNSLPPDNRSRGGSKESLAFVYSEDDSTTLGSDGVEYTHGGRSASRGHHPGQHSHPNSLAGGNSSLDPTMGGSFRGSANGSHGVNKEDRLETATRSTVAVDTDSSDKDLKRGGTNGVGPRHYKVYWQRWIMLLYMSVLNLLSDWTCYSVAPIAVLTSEAFGAIDPEQLVVVFLGANAVATACEPIILSRLGLRRTVVLGALLMMTGSIIKSGGLPPIIESTLNKGEGEWRVYLGFFLVGLSQPLYQCTPALLSASWFPERERTMATGVALNANQLGIGFAFVFGTLLVATSDDIVPYFGLLSIISALTFVGALIQFDDAPPTPPSETARVMRGDLEWRLPDAASNIWQSVRNLGASSRSIIDSSERQGRSDEKSKDNARRSKPDSSAGATATSRANPSVSTTRRRQPTPTPSNASTNRPVRAEMKLLEAAMTSDDALLAPSPMMPGAVGGGGDGERPVTSPTGNNGTAPSGTNSEEDMALQTHSYPPYHAQPPYHPYHPPPPGPGGAYPPPPYYAPSPPHYFDPTRSSQSQMPQQQQQQMYHSMPTPQQGPPQGYYGGPAAYQYHPYYYGYPPTAPTPQAMYGSYPYGYDAAPYPAMGVNRTPSFEEGAEPTLTQTDHHLDINIRDDQIILSTRACFSRPGFIHALVCFTVSGIVINTLSTFMDYLVRLNGAGREYVGIVGGSFQGAIMVSSLIIGKQTDRTRAYYSVSIGMLVLGAFALAECGVSLDANRGGDLRWSLIVVAILVGPLQPVSTELGVEVAYPLSENTVLVIQQLFSNLLSALFIPFFKALRDVGTEHVAVDANNELYERPQYTFSFYLLIVLHAAVTIFFATFNGRYLRYEHELAKKEKEHLEMGGGVEDDEVVDEGGFYTDGVPRYEEHPQMASMYPNERQPLMASGVHHHRPVV